GVAAEGFALAGDVHVWRGELAPADYSVPTPDGRPTTREFAGERLARVVCADREMLDEPDIGVIADALWEAQVTRIGAGLERARGASGRRTVRRGGPPNVQADQDRRRRGALDGRARDGPVRARARRPPPRRRAGRRRRRDRRSPPGQPATSARAIPLAPGRGSAAAFLGGYERQHRRLA